MPGGPSGASDPISRLTRAVELERRVGTAYVEPGLLAAVLLVVKDYQEEVGYLKGRVADLDMALETAKTPQVRVDLPHTPAGPHIHPGDVYGEHT